MSKQTYKRYYPTTKQPKCIIKANPKQKANTKLVDRIARKIEYDPKIRLCDFICGKEKKIFYVTYNYYVSRRTYLETELFPIIQKDPESQYIIIFMSDSNQNKSLDNSIIEEINFKMLNIKATLIVANSYDEAARYIEGFGLIENNVQHEQHQISEKYQIVNALSMVQGLNSQNAYDLLNKFITLKRIGVVEKDALKKSKQIGPRKVENLWKVFHVPFISIKKSDKKIQSFLTSLTIPKKKRKSDETTNENDTNVINTPSFTIETNKSNENVNDLNNFNFGETKEQKESSNEKEIIEIIID